MELKDVPKMPSVVIQKGNGPISFIEGIKSNTFQKLDSILSDSYTAAFLIIRNDSIIYEKYFDDFDKKSLLPSFSVSKSFVGTLVGIAVQEEKISVNDPITKFIPELKKKDSNFEKISIQQLLDMRSGIQFFEGSYDLKDESIKLAFKKNIEKQIQKLKIEKPAGGDFNYQSINTLLLAIALERATGKSISQYLSEKIWVPVGMEFDATWTVDSKKHLQEIAYAGINATARDYAKLGQLYLMKGFINNHSILSKDWVQTTTSADTMQKYDGYKNQFWGVSRYIIFRDSLQAVQYKLEKKSSNPIRFYINSKKEKAFFITYSSPEFYAQGILGEFVYVHPSKNLIIVRLGHYWKSKAFPDAINLLKSLADEL
ncbi:MAG: serine hydrolase [Ginsengibacter sp.]